MASSIDSINDDVQQQRQQQKQQPRTTYYENMTFDHELEDVDHHESGQRQQHRQQQASRIDSQCTTSPILLAWKNLTYTVNVWNFGQPFKPRREKKIILRRLNGSIRQHSLNGLLGPSGSGKTSLIKCLTGNVPKKNTTTDTELYLNQSLLIRNDQDSMATTNRSLIGFVNQIIFEKFTVEEILRYAFCFKNSQQNYDERKMMAHIHSTIQELMLDERVLANRYERCSGGEQRRIAIAQELMAMDCKPSFLFVDEPTTGLDSEAALLVMQCLRKLSQQNRMAIIVSIHAPSSDILNLFDQLFIMARGGVCVYCDHPNRMQQNLSNVLNIELDADRPPIEQYLSIASNGIHDEKVRRLADDTLEQVYRRDFQSEQQQQLPQQDMNMRESCRHQLKYIPDGRIPRRSKSFQWNDLCTQSKRFFRLIFVVEFQRFLFFILSNLVFVSVITLVNDRDMILANGCYPHEHLIANQTTIMASSNSGLQFPALNRTCQEELRENLLISIFITYNMVMNVLLLSIGIGISSIYLVIPLKVSRIEHQNGWYSLGTLFWSIQLIMLIKMSLIALNVTIISYLTADYMRLDDYQLNWNRFGHFLLFNWLLMIYLQSHGQLCVTILTDNIQILTVFGQMVLAAVGCLNGLIVTVELTGNTFLIIISHLVGVRHLVEGILYTFYGLDRCDPQLEYSTVLKKYYVNPETVYWNIWPTLMNIVGIRSTIFLLMYWKFGFHHHSKQTNKQNDSKTSDKIRMISSEPPIRINYDDVDARFQADNPEFSANKVIYSQNNDDNHNPKHNDNPEIINSNPMKNPASSGREHQLASFLYQRYMIGWRDLSLFATSSIYETRSAPDPACLYSTCNDSSTSTKKMILYNLNGQLRFGTINALMGTSGSGKTSLLKVLNGRMKTRLTDCTKFYLSKYVPIRTCFISQDISGHLLPGLTAKQSLIYASRLKNDFYQTSSSAEIDHDQIAEKLLEELDAQDASQTLVQNCSDGQRKRLALALELTSLRMPNLICIDEPTSGLDSNSARLVVECLQRLVHERHQDITIVASIHQPNTELLMLFDQCYVLSRDGVCIYSGMPGQIKTFLSQFESLTKATTSASSRHRFPIETLIQYSCTKYDNQLVQDLQRETEIRIKSEDQKLLENTVMIADGVEYNRNRFSFQSVWTLSQRYGIYLLRYQWREWLISFATFANISILCILVFDHSIAQPSGCIDLEEDFIAKCTDQSDQTLLDEIRITNSMHFLCLSSVLFSMVLMMQTMFTFVNELKYFSNEHRNGWYSCGSFYLSKLFYEILPLIPIVMIYVYITDIYEPVTPNNYYGWQVLILLLGSISLIAIAHSIVLITNGNFIFMVVIDAFIVCTFMVLSNLFNPVERLPYILQIVSNFSIFLYMNQSSFWLVYGGDRCPPNHIQSILYQMMIPNTREHFFKCIFMLMVLAIFYHCLALLVLIIKTNPKSNRRRRVQRIREYQTDRLELFSSSSTTSSASSSSSSSNRKHKFHDDDLFGWP